MSKPLLFAEDVQFWYETLRVFGADEYGGSQFGEVQCRKNSEDRRSNSCPPLGRICAITRLWGGG